MDRLAIDPPQGFRSSAAVPSTTLTSKSETRKLTSFFVRPGYGERGKPVQIESNFFAVRAIGQRGKII